MNFLDKAADRFQSEDVSSSANQCKQKIAQFAAQLENGLSKLLLNMLNRFIGQDLAAAVDDEDVMKFTDAIKEFDSMTKLDVWKTTLLLRVKELLKAKEIEDEDGDLT
ncbi:hypothetical protein AgCh_027350 [Apium graveolens]